MNRHIFKTLSDTEEILCYDASDGLYHLGGEQIIKVLLENISGDRILINYHTRNEVVKHVRYRMIVDRRQFDKDPNVLHFKCY